MQEREQIKHHPETGYRLLVTCNEYYRIADYVLALHERWDGSGYPSGMEGEKIPWESRVIAIVDAYDAMTSVGYCPEAISEEKAIAAIKKNAGTKFDRDIAKTFVEKVLGKAW